MSDFPATHRPPTTSEWTSIGVRFFSWAAGTALVLAAVFLFRSSGGHPWLRAGLGLGTGIALVVVAERWIAAKYRVTGNALDAAGIGILFATLYAMYARWALVPLVVAFIGMLLVTVAAVALATRRDSIFIAILGLLGGFVTAFLLSSTENYPLAVFAYILALSIGIAWLAARKGWWLLSALERHSDGALRMGMGAAGDQRRPSAARRGDLRRVRGRGDRSRSGPGGGMIVRSGFDGSPPRPRIFRSCSPSTSRRI